jgi:SOS-response transcriptional repressor LexA
LTTLAINLPYAFIDNIPKENLSTRLTDALHYLGVSQSELARRIGVKPQVIQYLCVNNATKSKFAFNIADALGIHANWLIAGQGQMLDKILTKNLTKIPLIDWADIDNWITAKNSPLKIVEYINTEIDTSEKYYALRMPDNSMSPRFEAGTLLIIDPLASAQENDFVIVITRFSPTPILRQLVKKYDKLFLIPNNSALYKELEVTAEDKICGVLRQTFYEFARK